MAAEKAENRKALRLFGLTALVLLLLLLANVLYVVYGTRYSEYAVTKDVTIELLKDDGSSEAASPQQVFPDDSGYASMCRCLFEAPPNSIPLSSPQSAPTPRSSGTEKCLLPMMNPMYPAAITSVPSPCWWNFQKNPWALPSPLKKNC